MFIVSLAVACTYSDLLHGQWIFRAVIGQFQVRMYPYGPLALDHRSTEKKITKKHSGAHFNGANEQKE